MRPILTVFALCAAAGFARGAEVGETYRNAYGAFLQGRIDDAASAYRYLDTLGIGGTVPTVNLALLARDAGRPEEALPLWTKASLLEPRDAFIWNQRAWCYLSMGRYRDARDTFHKALSVSTSTAWTSEADFGLGLTEMLNANLKASAAAFQGGMLPSPYMIGATAALLGELALDMKRFAQAELYFKQSLNQDPIQPDVLRKLANVYQRADDPRAAWLAYKNYLDLDPSDAQAQRGLEKEARYIVERPERLLAVRRLARPLIQHPQAPPASDRADTVRVGLYSSAATGEPGTLRHFFFMAGSDFKVIHTQIGEVTQGLANEQWEATANRETGVVELRDVHGRIQYATKQAFRIAPSSAGATVLIKNPEVLDIRGVDIGDMEMRGIVEAVPDYQGIQLVNEVGVEQYLYGQVAQAMPAGAPPEALKVEAVFSRTELEWIRKHAGMTPPLNIHLCDSRACKSYSGVSQEREEATRAVLDTAGVKLYRGGDLVPVRQHLYCGGETEEGVWDTPVRKGAASAYDFERRIHDVPEKDLFDEQTSLAQVNWARWARVLDAQDLRPRLGPEHDVGRIHDVRVARRSAAGRVDAVEVVGSLGRATLEGKTAIENFLSPGGLRSNLFTLQPLYSGRALDRLVVWGLGTGDGHGLCVAGAVGLTVASGKTYQAVLEHYFPGAAASGSHPLKALKPGRRRAKSKRLSANEGARAKARAAMRAKLKAKSRAKVSASSGPSEIGKAAASKQGKAPPFPASSEPEEAPASENSGE